MQDGASIHSAKVTLKWLDAHTITLFDNPSRSPDLNPIENVWGYLARHVYEDGKQYNSIPDLVAAIKRVWSAIPISYLKNLIKSIPKRCLEVVTNKVVKRTINVNKSDVSCWGT